MSNELFLHVETIDKFNFLKKFTSRKIKHKHSLTYVVVTFRKVRPKSNFGQVGINYI